MKIISWNVNGLRAGYKKGFLDWFKKEKPDILCLQETKAMKEQLPEDLINVPGYYFHIEPAQRKGYSGTAIYSKETPKEITTNLGVEKFDIEGRIQIAEYSEFILFNIYFPNGGASRQRLEYKLDFYEELLAAANKLKKKGKKIIICGDVNTAHKEIDLARPKPNSVVSGFLPQEREWIDRLVADGYIDTFREFNQDPDNYSWWDLKTRARERNVGWRIDYFFISENLRPFLQDAFILSDVMGSDHCPVGIKINTNKLKS